MVIGKKDQGKKEQFKKERFLKFEMHILIDYHKIKKNNIIVFQFKSNIFELCIFVYILN